MNAPIRAALSFSPASLFRAGRTFSAAALVLISGLKLSAAPLASAVEVIGSVEIVGEPHKQPFVASATESVPYGPLNSILTVPLPAGKRVVIESISVNSSVPVGAKPVGWIQLLSKVGGGSGTSGLQFFEQGPLGGKSFFSSVTPATMRVNTDQQYLQVNVYRVNSSGAYNFTVSVFGYVESL